jgi:formaldehyde-activating enzyme involved in methanogenesis
LAVVDAVPPNVHVRESVVAFAPAVVGFPRTSTVQVALEPARVFVPQLSVVIVKFVVSEIEGAEHPVAVAPPEFVSVKVWVVEFDPTLMFPKSNVSGDQARLAAIPVTTIWFVVVVEVPPNVQVRERVATFAPTVVGLPATLIVQVAPEPASVLVPQVSVESVKSVELSMVGAEHPVAVAVPEFVSVKVWVAEEEPTLMLPKLFVSGVQARTGAIPVTVIWFAVVVDVPPKVHVRERVAVLSPEVVGLPATLIVQVAPEPASVLVPQVSVESVKSVELSMVGAEHPVAVAVPEFVKVKVWVADEDPTFTLPNAFVSGDQARLGAIPVTVIWFVVVVEVPPKVQVRESVAVFAPVEAGEPATLIVQVAPEPASVLVPQVSVESVKSVELSMVGAEHPVAVAVPEFVNVKVWVADEEPTFTLPKAFVRGDQARTGAVPVTVI